MKYKIDAFVKNKCPLWYQRRYVQYIKEKSEKDIPLDKTVKLINVIIT